ncbi:MAG: glycosyltransferase family 1 protein [Patescibacteria group bacterium]
MIIGIDASRANQDIKTGTEWYSYHLIIHLSRLDRANQYVLYSKDTLKGDLKNLGPNFKSRVLNWPPKFLWSQLRLSVEMLFHPPEVLFVPAHTIPLIHPPKTITTCHDVGFERYPELYETKSIGGRKFISLILGILTRVVTFGKYGNNELDYHRFSIRQALKHTYRIITPSHFTRQEIINLYKTDKNRITVVYNGFNQSNLGKVSDESLIGRALEKYNINKPYIFFLGRLERKKNIKGAFAAFKLFKEKYQTEHQLVLVGKRGLGYNEAQEIIKSSPIKNDIKEIGWIAEEDKVLLLNGADFLYFPSFYEGFGIPPLEALACGLPVIASNRGSLPEILEDSAIFVDPNNIQEMAQAMYQLTVDPNIRSKLIKNGLERIKIFSWQNCARQTLNVLKGIK